MTGLKVANFVLFQLAWFAAVVGAARGAPWLGVVAVTAAVAFHLGVRAAGELPRRRELAFLLVVTLAGAALDTLVARLGTIRYAEGGAASGSGPRFVAVAFPPAWIVALWLLFATLFHRSMAWLQGRPWLAALFGLLGAPLSYVGGERLGAVAFPDPRWRGLLVAAGTWAVAMPFLLALSARARGERWRVGRTVAAALLVGAPALAAARACGLGKDALFERLRALPKNATLPAAAFHECELACELGGQPRRIHVRYFRGGPTRGGDGAAPPILLLHGTPSTFFTWTQVLGGGVDDAGRPFDGLTADFDVIAPDLVGHGATGPAVPPLDTCDFDTLVAFVAAFLRELRIDRAVVVGHSYGGEVAWRLALAEPGRVARLVLIDSSGYRRPDDDTPVEERVLKHHPLARIGRLATSLADTRDVLAISFVKGVPPDEAAENYLLVQNADNWSAMIDLAQDEEGRAESRIATLALPTLLLWGAGDRNFVPERHAARFARDVRGSRLVLLADCGHYAPIEQAARVVAEIRAFARE